MKLLRNILISSLTACAAFASTVYISCTKESCSIVCANGGTCNSAVCICQTGFEGSNCQNASRDKFLGVWNVHETGTITTASEFTANIDTAIGSVVTQIRIKNFYNKYPTPVLASISGNSLTIAPQVMPNFDTVSGWGTYQTNNNCPTGKVFLYFRIGTVTSGADDFGINNGSPAILGCN